MGGCLHFSLSVLNLHGLLVPLALFHSSSSLALLCQAVNFPSKPLGHDWRDLSRGFGPLRGLSRLPPASCYHNHQKSSFKPLSHLYLSYMCGGSQDILTAYVCSARCFLLNTYTAAEAKCWTIYTVYLLSDILDIFILWACCLPHLIDCITVKWWVFFLIISSVLPVLVSTGVLFFFNNLIVIKTTS